MTAQEIQNLIDFIAQSGLAEVHIKTQEIELNIKKYPKQTTVAAEPAIIAAPAAPVFIPQAPVARTEAPAQSVTAAETAPKTADESRYIAVKSPMIGTFYRASSPESPAFVKIGDKISKGQTVGVIEAMKLFNEIEADVAGTIVKVLVENASPVEYEQALFLVDPA